MVYKIYSTHYRRVIKKKEKNRNAPALQNPGASCCLTLEPETLKKNESDRDQRHLSDRCIVHLSCAVMLQTSTFIIKDMNPVRSGPDRLLGCPALQKKELYSVEIFAVTTRKEEAMLSRELTLEWST